MMETYATYVQIVVYTHLPQHAREHARAARSSARVARSGR
jgi:hypothetical protein